MPFTIRTDQYSLKYLLSQNQVQDAYNKWVYKLLGFNFDIEYKPGGSNTVADALSRQPMITELQELHISKVQVLDQSQIQTEIDQDPRWQKMIKALQTDPDS